MSTIVDINKPRRSRTASVDMRPRVLTAAAKAFTRASYDAIGVREIAAMANTDPAIVIRLFGSKAKLFGELAEAAFGNEEVFQGPLETMGERLAHHLMQPFTTEETDTGDEFQLLLRSATSLVAAPILSAELHRALIEPLGRRIGKVNGAARAALVTAQVLGFSTLRFALGSPAIEAADQKRIEQLLARAIQLCVDG
jgi:AcrR family transcriptional regulator